MDEAGGNPLRVTWEQAHQLALAERRLIRAAVGEIDCDEVVHELTFRLMKYPPEAREAKARKRFARQAALTEIAEHFRRRKKQLGGAILSDPHGLEADEDEPRNFDSPQPWQDSGDHDDVVIELQHRLSSLQAAPETCPVERHRFHCPEAVRRSVAGALEAVASRLTPHADDEQASEERRSVLDQPRDELRENEITRRVVERGCSRRTAERWVERVILPCFDWWIYRAVNGLDGFDGDRYARVRAAGHEIWPNPLPHEWTSARKFIRAVKMHRWMVLRHIKVVAGVWDSEKYGIKRMRALLPAHPDLQVIIRIHMPAAARALGLEEAG